jgi:hypothetical protein
MIPNGSTLRVGAGSLRHSSAGASQNAIRRSISSLGDSAASDADQLRSSGIE